MNLVDLLSLVVEPACWRPHLITAQCARIDFLCHTKPKALRSAGLPAGLGKSKHDPSESNEPNSQTHSVLSKQSWAHHRSLPWRKWRYVAPLWRDSRLPGISDTEQQFGGLFWKIRRHQNLHWVYPQDTALQLGARRTIRETVQQHVSSAGLDRLMHKVQEQEQKRGK